MPIEARVGIRVAVDGAPEARTQLQGVSAAERDVGAAGTDAARGVDDLGDGLDETTARARKSESAVESLTAGLGGMVKGVLAVGAVSKAWEWMSEGGQLLDLDATVRRLGVDLDALSDAAGGAFSRETLGGAAVNANKLGVALGLTSAQTRSLTEDAARLADAFDVDLEEAVSKLFTAISGETGSLKESFGLFVQGEDAVKAYAAALGTLPDKLTEAERRTAVLEAIQAKLNESLASAPVQTYGDQLDAAAAKLDDFAAAVKKAAAQMYLLPAIEASTGDYASQNRPSGNPEADRLAQARNRISDLHRQLASGDFETSGFFDVSRTDDRVAAEKALRDAQTYVAFLERARVAADTARRHAADQARVDAEGDAANAAVLASGAPRPSARGSARARADARWDPRALGQAANESMGGAPMAAVAAIGEGLKVDAQFAAQFAVGAEDLGGSLLAASDDFDAFLDGLATSRDELRALTDELSGPADAAGRFGASFQDSLGGMLDSALDTGGLIVSALGGVTQAFGAMVTNLIVGGDAGAEAIGKQVGNMAAGLSAQAFSMALFLEGMAVVAALTGPLFGWSAPGLATAGLVAAGIGGALAVTARALGADQLGGAGSGSRAGGGGGGSGPSMAGTSPFGAAQEAPTVIVYIGGEQITRSIRTETRRDQMRGGIGAAA